MSDISLDVINHISNKNRSAALDMINDLMNVTASEAISDYKKVVASTYFDEPAEPLEVEQ